MKTINKFTSLTLALIAVLALSSCALGSATAGYALRAKSADELSSDAEQKIVSRTKHEIFSELTRQKTQSVAASH